MSGAQPNRGIGPNRRPLLSRDILTAQENSRSAAEAARYLKVNYSTYRKYAVLYDLFKNHTNKTGKGIPRKKMKGVFGLDSILAGEHPTYDRGKLKERIIRAGKLPERCNLCGFNEKRIFDGRCPLVLHSKDGDNHNLTLDNLELRCYNCSYLTTGTVSVKSESKTLNAGVFDNDLMETQELSPDELDQLRDEMWSDDYQE